MNSAILAYLETTYKKIRLLRQTEKSAVWLAADRAGQMAVLKRLALTGLPRPMTPAKQSRQSDTQKRNCLQLWNLQDRS